jgi:hypothetical protein
MKMKANKQTVLAVVGGLAAGRLVHELFRGNLLAEYHFILYSLYVVGLGFAAFVARYSWLNKRREQSELREKLQ